jgi:hypothetical protein
MLNCATPASLAPLLAWISYVEFAIFFPPFSFRICLFAVELRRRQESPVNCTLLSQCAHKARLRRDQAMQQALSGPLAMI